MKGSRVANVLEPGSSLFQVGETSLDAGSYDAIQDFGNPGRAPFPSRLGQICTFVVLLVLTGSVLADDASHAAVIGDSERVYALADENTDVRGLAFDDRSVDTRRLFVLDRSGKIFVYRFDQDEQQADEPPPTRAAAVTDLHLEETHDLPSVAGSSGLVSPRGLAFAVEGGREVLYFLNWCGSQGAPISQLWRYELGDAVSAHVDLSLHVFRIGDREALDLAYDDGQLLVSFDASGYPDANLRVRRGIIRITWSGPFGETPTSVQHLPDAGTLPARGLACMQFDGARFLWATVGDEHIYCADGRTGRGLFFFDRPTSVEDSPSCWGMCFGRDALWVSENVAGPDRVHRVNVTKNLDAFYEGPRVLRRLVMSIQTEPATEAKDPGAVYHYYSRPYGYEQLHNQGIWPDTELVEDLSVAPNATIRQITHDPAGDVASRQIMQCVEYANAPAADYASRYQIDLWTNAYKRFVYPHRVDDGCEALEGTDYLADDPELYGLRDTATYAAFIERVTSHIAEKYGVDADMRNPYWAARNIVEYIQDNYYYPNRSKRKPATVDYDRQHYDANPGNLKIELSARPYDKSQIIACSGTSVMVAGALRHLGIPARWLGTGTQMGAGRWDSDGDGLLEADETAPCTNGHRYTQAWLGSHYGWICFDATPSKPALNDYDPPPPLQSQWRYMTRAAGGHRENRRIVFNVGSELYRPLYRDFEYDPLLAIDNNCGGDQRYNLQGRYEASQFWRRPRHSIRLKNLCFIENVAVAGPRDQSLVTWDLAGAWDKIEDATVSVYLQQVSGGSNEARDVARVAHAIPCDAKSVQADLSAHRGKRFRIILRRDGDPETGGHSQLFDLE